jgi:hypothetical protein
MAMETTRRPRLLVRVRERFRVKHFSLRTEPTYGHWICRFIVFHDTHGTRGWYPESTKLRRKL